MKKELLIVLVFAITLSGKSQSTMLVPFQENNLWGFVDTNMTVIIDVEYDSVSIYKSGRAVVKKGLKYGLIDEEGNLILKLRKLKSIINIGHSGVITTDGKGNKKYYNLEGKRIKEITAFASCGNGLPQFYEENKYSISKNSAVALIYNYVEANQYGSPIIVKDTTAFTYFAIEKFGTRSFIVKDSSGTGIWHPDDFYVKIEPKFDNIEVTKGVLQNKYLHKYWNNELAGLINTRGEKITEANYYSIELVLTDRRLDDLIKVEYDKGKFGYIDIRGKEFFKRL